MDHCGLLATRPYEMRPQKEIERQYLHSFRCLRGDFPGGDLRDHETPDFLVVTETQRKIGIEITRVFKADGKSKNSQQSIEATKEAITVFARTYSERLSSPPVEVSLFFNLRRPLNVKAQLEIAWRVAQVVHGNMPFQGESVELEYRRGCRRDQPIEVDLICINRVHPVDYHQWTWLEMGDVQTDAITLLEGAIKRGKMGSLLDLALCGLGRPAFIEPCRGGEPVYGVARRTLSRSSRRTCGNPPTVW